MGEARPPWPPPGLLRSWFYLLSFMRLRKKLCNCEYFLLFVFFLQQIWTDWPDLLVKFSSVLKLGKCGLIQTHRRNVSCNLKFCLSKHDMACASRKTIMADVSGHTSEHVNLVNIFLDVTSYSMAGILLKVINVFRGEDSALFTVTRIRSILKSTKNRNSETRWNPRWK